MTQSEMEAHAHPSLHREDIGPVAVVASAMEGLVIMIAALVSVLSALTLLLLIVSVMGWAALAPVLWIKWLMAANGAGDCCPAILMDLRNVLGNPQRNLMMIWVLLAFGAAFKVAGITLRNRMGPIMVIICFLYVLNFCAVFLRWSVDSWPMDMSKAIWFSLLAMIHPGVTLIGWIGDIDVMQQLHDAPLYSSAGYLNLISVGVTLSNLMVTIASILICVRIAASASALFMGLVSSKLYLGHIAVNLGSFRRSVRRRRWPRLRSLRFVMMPALRMVALGYAVFLGTVVGYLLFGERLADLILSMARNPNFFQASMGLSNKAAFYLLVFLPVVSASLGFAIVMRQRRDNRLAAEILVLTLIFPVVCAVARIPNLFTYVLGFPAVFAFLAVRRWVWIGIKESWDRLQVACQRDVSYEQFLADQPILYLRAFMDDRKTLSARFSLVDFLMGVRSNGQRFEEVVAERAFNWRPVVALGNPHLEFQLHGVWKREIPNGSDDAWQSEVKRLLGACAFTIMIANTTDNIGWEIDRLTETGNLDRIVFVLTDPAVGQSFFRHFGILGGATRIDRGALVVYHDHQFGWTMLTSPLRTNSAYTIALDIAIARLEGALASQPIN